MTRILMGVMLAGALSIVPTTFAQDNGHDRDGDRGQRTYYDAGNRDRHQWDDHEASAWNTYRTEHHVRQSDFGRTSRKQQQKYWNWRHEHQDNQ